MALLNLCIGLAQTSDELTRWGRAHTTLIDAQSDPVFHQFRAAYADHMAGLRLKETAQ